MPGHPRCYAQALYDCEGKPSGEHYVSDKVLRAVSQAEKSVRVSGLKFLPFGIVNEIGISSLVGNTLCKKHNSDLSVFDNAGLNFFNAMEHVPIFHPAFRRASNGKPHLAFGTIKSVISGDFPAASFQATLFACTRRLPTPVVYIEAASAHKKEVKRRLQTPSLFGNDPPPDELRSVKVIPNTVAQEEGFYIPTNMRVPVASVIYCLFDAEPLSESHEKENLSLWESQRNALDNCSLFVEGRKGADRVIAIAQPMGKIRRVDALISKLTHQ